MMVDFMGMRLPVEEVSHLDNYWKIETSFGPVFYRFIDYFYFEGYKFGLVVHRKDYCIFTIYLTAPYDDLQQIEKLRWGQYVQLTLSKRISGRHVNLFLSLIIQWVRRVLWQNVIDFNTERPVVEVLDRFAERMEV